MDDSRQDLPLETFAAVSAAIAEGDRALEVVLVAHGLGPEEWRLSSERWSFTLAADEALADAFTQAFLDAQDRLKPVPPMTPEEWAALVVEVAAEGPQALIRRSLSAADHARLARRWARALGTDKILAARYHQAFYAAQRGPR